MGHMLRGIFLMVLFIANTLLWATPLLLLAVVKLLLPPLRRPLSLTLTWLAETWARCNHVAIRAFLPTQWHLRVNANVARNGQYLACANHQSWNDIVALMMAFEGRAPFFKFFLKKELIWVPVLGLAWWALDYPFMKRHTAAQIARRPELAGQDLATTRRACARFKDQPVMVLNFLEGTRFTPVKHAQQGAPYRHLLKPKTGGLAFAAEALHPQVTQLIDVTLAYPHGGGGLWALLSGQIPTVVVEAQAIDIPPALSQGDYAGDPEHRAAFQAWVADLWQRKDDRLAEVLTEFRS